MVLFRHTWSTESMYLHVLYMTIGDTKEPNIQVYGNYKKGFAIDQKYYENFDIFNL